MTSMTDDEVVKHMRDNTSLNKVRTCLSGIIGAAEQASRQRRPPSPLETRKSEFAAVTTILEVAEQEGLIKRI